MKEGSSTFYASPRRSSSYILLQYCPHVTGTYMLPSHHVGQGKKMKSQIINIHCGKFQSKQTAYLMTSHWPLYVIFLLEETHFRLWFFCTDLHWNHNRGFQSRGIDIPTPMGQISLCLVSSVSFQPSRKFKHACWPVHPVWQLCWHLIL